MALAAVIGRFLLGSRVLTWLVAFLGVFGAMAANVMHDGQGALVLLIYAPVIYFFAVAGRDEMGGWRKP